MLLVSTFFITLSILRSEAPNIMVLDPTDNLPKVKGLSTSEYSAEEEAHRNKELEDLRSRKKMVAKIEKIMKLSSGMYSVYIKDLKDEDTVVLGEITSKYSPASTFKIISSMLILKDLETGSSEWGVLGSGSENEEDRYVSISNLVTEAIVHSSNTYHESIINTLGSTIGREGIDIRIKKELGIEDTSLVEFTTTASDLGAVLESLANSTYLDEENSRFLLDQMKNSTYNRRIKSGVPQEIVVANKYGGLGEFHHDAGVVFLEDTDYILVILSKGLSSNVADSEQSLMSRVVWMYMQNKEYI